MKVPLQFGRERPRDHVAPPFVLDPVPVSVGDEDLGAYELFHRAEGAPAVPMELSQQGRKIGELRSAVNDDAGFIGLALVSLVNLHAAEPLQLAAGGAVTLSEVP